MKRFVKILTICLATIVLVTVLTVVSVAAISEPYTFTKTQGGSSLDFDSWDTAVLKTTANNDGVSTSTIEIREAYPGGNKYMYFSPGGSSSGAASWYSEITYSRSTYDVTEAPIMAVDFDVMTLNGSFGNSHNSVSLVIRPYYYNSDTSKYQQFSSSSTGAAESVALGQISGLDKTAYVWQHVTVIYEWVTGGTINTYVYVNGSTTPGLTATKDVSSSYTAYPDYIDQTFFGVPYFSAARWGQNSEVGLDNYKQTYFPAGYDIADIPTYIYNENYEMPEAYKYTVASVTDNAETPVTTYYDDLDEAIAALQDGYTLTLAEAPADPIVINNAITLDTAGFEVTVESTAGYGITATTDGVHTIEKLPSATVTWDACPTPDSCACLGAHKLAGVSYVVVGDIPEYPFDIPELEFDGLVLTLLGWSYENDGTVDELSAITAADAETGVNLYPVFSQAYYDFRLDSNGVITYYTADQYAEAFDGADKVDGIERTITLLRDAEVYDKITLSAGYTSSTTYSKVKLDLRGNTLTRVNLSGNKYTFDGTEYVADGTLSASDYAFYCNKPKTYFTITSSVGKGNFVTYSVSGDIYYDENGAFERYEATTVTGASFIDFYNNANRHVTLSNLNIYAQNVFSASGGANKDCSFTMTDCNYYLTYGSTATMSRTMYFESSTTFTVNISDSLFYIPAGVSGTTQFVRLADNSVNSNYSVTLDNCDIIGMTKITFFNFYDSTPVAKCNVQVNNTRFYNTTGNNQRTTYLGDGTLYSATQANTSTVTSGHVSVPSAETATYTVPASTAVTIDADSKQPVLSMDTTDIRVTFEYEIKKCSEVAESITDARLSMLYYSNFNLMLYLPVTEGMSVPEVSGFEIGAETVLINGNSYYVYSKECSTTGVSDTVAAKVTYTVDGETYRQTFNVSALIYADLILNYHENDVETTAVANMVRYIKEARLAQSLEAGDEFDELIALGNLAELGEQADYADTTVDYSTLSGYVKSVQFMLDGTNAAYVITMTDTAVSAGATVTVSYLDGDGITVTQSVVTETVTETDADGVETSTDVEVTRYVTSGTRVYDVAANAIEITVTVPAAEEGGEATVITGTYSVKAYINATNDTLTKAMYEFGVAAKAYREYLETL